jgi:UPF0716 protein FxsA
MSFVKWTIIGLMLLPVTEAVAFILVVLTFGWFLAIVTFIATSLAGVYLLRRTGRGDLDRFLTSVNRDGIRSIHLNTPGLATMIGGILLVFPGFVTDLLGALLFVSPLRRWIAGQITHARSQRRAERNPSLIELAPGEWRQVTSAALEDQKRRGKPTP